MPFSCFLFHPRKSCEKHRKCSHTNVSNASVIRFSTPPAQTATFAFTSESGYTLGFTQKIAHKGTHGETGGFTFVQSCRAFDRPSSGKRTAGGSGCTPTACVRFLRHRGPAGPRDLFTFVEIAACTPCVQCFPHVWGRGGITTLGALCVLLKRRTVACQNGSFAAF